MPPRGWSRKRERQYEHIKDGLADSGRPEAVAEEIAARTVNKERARAGEAQQVEPDVGQGHLVEPAGRAAFPLGRRGSHQGPALPGS